MNTKVVIVGAGFGGLNAAKAFAGQAVDVTLVDTRNFHIFQPLLYQVATAALEPEQIVNPVRGLLHDLPNVRFELATVTGVDWSAKHVLTRDNGPIPFDYLILAVGAIGNDFGIAGVKEHAFGLKDINDALTIRNHIIQQFEKVDARIDPRRHTEAHGEESDKNLGATSSISASVDEQQGALTFVVVGGGPTGVEMAGALTELFHLALRKDYPRIDIKQAKVILLEAMDKLLPPFDARLREDTLRQLQKRGVDVRFGQAVVQVTPDAVTLKSGEVIPTQTVIWGAGVKAHPLAAALGVPLGRGGRIVVNDDLSIPDHPEAFVIGDLGAGKDTGGNIYPQLAQAAIQSGKHTAAQILRRIRNEATQPFAYKDPGFMATIGRNAAVAQFPNGAKFTGFFAWALWLFLHLMFLIGFRNRVQVFVNWVWSYLWHGYPGAFWLGRSYASPLKVKTDDRS